MVKIKVVIIVVILLCHTNILRSQIGIKEFVQATNSHYNKIAHKQNKAIRKFARIALKEHPVLNDDSIKFVPIYSIYAKRNKTDYKYRFCLSKDSLFTYFNIKSMKICRILVFKNNIFIGEISSKAKDVRLNKYVQPIYTYHKFKINAEIFFSFGYTHGFCLCEGDAIMGISNNIISIFVRKESGNIIYSPREYIDKVIISDNDVWRYVDIWRPLKEIQVYGDF